MGNVSLNDCVLECERHQFSMFRCMQYGLAELSDSIEGRGEIDILESSGAKDLDVDLPCQGQHWCPIDLGVPKSSEKVSRPGTRNS